MAYLALELLNLALRLILIEFHYLSKLLFLLLNVQSHLCFIGLSLLIYVLELLLHRLFDLLLHEVLDVLLGLLVQAVQVAAVFVEEVFALHVDLLAHGIGQALVLTLVGLVSVSGQILLFYLPGVRIGAWFLNQEGLILFLHVISTHWLACWHSFGCHWA